MVWSGSPVLEKYRGEEGRKNGSNMWIPPGGFGRSGIMRSRKKRDGAGVGRRMYCGRVGGGGRIKKEKTEAPPGEGLGGGRVGKTRERQNIAAEGDRMQGWTGVRQIDARHEQINHPDGKGEVQGK